MVLLLSAGLNAFMVSLLCLSICNQQSRLVPVNVVVPHPTLLQLAIIAAISAVGGGVNSIAGGGTLLTFPALLGLGIPGIVANATSTVALWPGSFGSMMGYRKELIGARHWAVRLAIPSILGGLTGLFY